MNIMEGEGNLLRGINRKKWRNEQVTGNILVGLMKGEVRKEELFIDTKEKYEEIIAFTKANIDK